MSLAKRVSATVLCCVVALAAGGCRFAQEIVKLTIDDVRPASVKDGEYTGSKSVMPVTATVRVTVKDGRIAAIKMLFHTHGPRHGAQAILDRVITAQSLAVDAVSGSTYSSTVVLKAIEIALRKGL